MKNRSTPAPAGATAAAASIAYVRRINWLRGKDLCADMVAEAIKFSGDAMDRADLQATFRGRGVEQHVFVRPYFDKAQADPDMLEGFLAALSSTLAVAGPANDDPASMQDLTWDDCVGTPETVYMTEEVSPGEEWRMEVDKLLREANAKFLDALGTEIRDKGEISAAVPLLREVSASIPDLCRTAYASSETDLRESLQKLLTQVRRATGLAAIDTGDSYRKHTRDAERLIEKAISSIGGPAGTPPSGAEAEAGKPGHAVPPTPSDMAADGWMRGKALFCDMGEKIAANCDRCWFEDEYRERGVSMYLDAAKLALATIKAQPELEDGFCAALTGFIAANFNDVAPYTFAEIRALKPEQCGPGTGVSRGTETADTEGQRTEAGGPAAWRLAVEDHMDQVSGLAEAAVNLDMDATENGWAARLLLWEAQKHIKDEISILKTGRANDCYGQLWMPVRAKILGARDMKETHSALPKVTHAALDILDSACNLINAAEEREIAAKRALEDSGNSEPADDQPVFTDPVEQRLDSLLARLDVYMEGLEHVGIGDAAYGELHKLVAPHFWTARDLLNAHEPIDKTMSEILLLQAALLVFEPMLDDYNPGRPLVRECMALIRHFLDDGNVHSIGASPSPEPESPRLTAVPPHSASDDHPDPARLEVARQGATFIARLVSYFQQPNRQGTMGDLAAIGKSASVIISALSDFEDVEPLRARLEDALESASVILKDQPPAYWKTPGILRERMAAHDQRLAA